MFSKKLKCGFVLLLILMLAGCGGRDVENTTKQKVKDKENSNVIKIGTQSSYVPFSFRENGRLKGLSYEAAKETFKRMGVEVEFKVYPWAKVLELAKSGELDGIIDASYNTARTEYLNYPQEPISLVSIYLYVLPGSDFVYDGNINSLKGKRVAVISGYAYGEAFDNARKENLFTVDENKNVEACYKKLVEKKVDVIIQYKKEFDYQMRKMEKSMDTLQKLTPAVVEDDKQYLAFSKKSSKVDAEFIRKFNDTLVQLKNDGTYNKIYKFYIK